MNLARDVLCYRGARDDGGRPALDHAGTRWSYDDLADAACHGEQVLRAVGVEFGDRVAIASENRPEYVAALLACARLGAVLTTIYLDFGQYEVDHILTQAKPRCVIVDKGGRELVSRCSALGPSPLIDITTIAPRLGDAHPTLIAEMPDETPILISYTSGSTAEPKAVMSTHGGERWAMRAHRSVWDLGPEDVVLVALPLAWVYGLCTVTLTSLAGGARVILLDRFRPGDVWQAILTEGVTAFFGVTTMYVMMVEYAQEHRLRLDETGLRVAACGGERRDEHVFDVFAGLTGTPVLDVYASSESRPVFAESIVGREPRPGTCGRLVPGVEAQLRRPDGTLAVRGEVGELWTRSPSTFAGYYGAPELTAERVDAEGWVRMGDLLYEDDEGYWYVMGRVGDLIIRAGANVSPGEVEKVLETHPDVRRVAVVGVSNPRYGEDVVAAVEGAFRSDGEATAALKAHSDGKLATYKVPTQVMLVESLPLGPTGKVDRKAVRRMFSDLTRGQ